MSRQSPPAIREGNMVFLRNIGLCRIVEYNRNAKDDEFDLWVRDSRGVMWGTLLNQVLDGTSSRRWINYQRARMLTRMVRGKNRFKNRN